MNLLEILEHAATPHACSFGNNYPAETTTAIDEGLITLKDAGYSQETVFHWFITPKGREHIKTLQAQTKAETT
jgi:hypothetical protein